MPNQQMIWVLIKLVILGSVIDISGSTSTHLVKYSIIVIMKLYPPKDGGTYLPMRSKPHYAKGHTDLMGLSS